MREEVEVEVEDIIVGSFLETVACCVMGVKGEADW